MTAASQRQEIWNLTASGKLLKAHQHPYIQKLQQHGTLRFLFSQRALSNLHLDRLRADRCTCFHDQHAPVGRKAMEGRQCTVALVSLTKRYPQELEVPADDLSQLGTLVVLLHGKAFRPWVAVGRR
jgi:hypothetical protein